MKYAIWIVAAATTWVGVACSSKAGQETPDAATAKPPTGFTFKTIAEKSIANFGWTGAQHGVTAVSGTPFNVKAMDCADPEGICAFEGPVPSMDQDDKVNRHRCLNHMRTTCDVDQDCKNLPGMAPDAVHEKCVYIYDAPTATPLPGAGGIGACAWTYIPETGAGGAKAIRGTIDLRSGELTLASLVVNLELNSGGSGGLRGACMECVGDDHPNDGVLQGTCRVSSRSGNMEKGPDEGKACDAHRTGAFKDYNLASYSMDCSPTVTATDAPPTVLGGSFTSREYVVETTASSPTCTAPGSTADKCFCGLCDDGVHSCRSDAECGAGKCGFIPDNCNPNPAPFSSSGTANTDYDIKYLVGECKGLGLPGSSSYVASRDNLCAGVCTWSEVSGTGTCVSAMDNKTTILCYPHGGKLVSPGLAIRTGKSYSVNTASASCAMPALNQPGQTAAVVRFNSQVGLPGLIFQRRGFQIFPEYSP
jgi:hypothetical protein